MGHDHQRPRHLHLPGVPRQGILVPNGNVQPSFCHAKKTHNLPIAEHTTTRIQRTKGYADMDHPPPHDPTHAIPHKPKRRMARTLAWMHVHPFASTGIALFLIPALVFMLAMGSTLHIPSLLPMRNNPPQLSDFIPPYVCPKTDAPESCTTPIKVSVECQNLQNINLQKRLIRPFTKTELLNTEEACKLLPYWLEQDLRITVTKKSNSDINLNYYFSATSQKFAGVMVFVDEENFLIKKHFSEKYDKASYFVEQSLIVLSKKGYLP